MAITGSFKTSTNTLDNFVGFSYDELISSNKYDYEFVLEQKKTDEVEPGIVVDQSPEAGSKVISGSQVKLVVSASMDDINVPNIYNLNDEKQRKHLQMRDLQIISLQQFQVKRLKKDWLYIQNQKPVQLFQVILKSLCS